MRGKTPTHGHARKGAPSPTYRTWYNMKTRCENPRSSKYRFYGGRGIKLCERWRSFEAFLYDMGERPSAAHTIDRYPNKDGDYEPNNCRWATQKEQNANRRSSRAVVRGDGRGFSSMAEAATSVNGDHRQIWDCCNGDQRTHRGYAWRYA